MDHDPGLDVPGTLEINACIMTPDRIISSTSHRREQLVPGPPAMRPINPRKSKMGPASKLFSLLSNYSTSRRVELNLFSFLFFSFFFPSLQTDRRTISRAARMANEDACR